MSIRPNRQGKEIPTSIHEGLQHILEHTRDKGCAFAGWRYDGMLCEADTVESGAMWECPLLARLQIVPEHARPTHSLLSGLKALSLNSFNNISAFHPKSNPVSPTADR